MKLTVIVLTVYCLSVFGCVSEDPVPPEVKLVEAQEMNLWRAGAHQYLPDEYAQYKADLNKTKNNLLKVNSRFRWFRDYTPVQMEFIHLLKQGDELLERLETEKHRKGLSVLDRINSLRERVHSLDKLSLRINEGKVSRIHLTKAEVILNEAKALYEENQYLASEEKLMNAETYIAGAEKGIAVVLDRYKDIKQIVKWRKWAEETVEESREKGIYSILVIKADKKLILYKNGEPLKTYRIGLGRNGWLNKRHARDNATPEGKYKIIRKNPKSRYYKALLTNYPNEEDKKEFLEAKKRGLLSETAGIGGLIEIHGGSKEGMTYGCISLDNRPMEELYNTVGVGTPVTIIGALNALNSLSPALTVIQTTHGQKKTP